MRCNQKVGASGAIVVRRDAALALPDWEIPTPTPGTWTGARDYGNLSAMETNKQAPFFFFFFFSNNKTCANHTRVEVVSRPSFSNAAITRVVGYMSKVFQQRRPKDSTAALGPH